MLIKTHVCRECGNATRRLVAAFWLAAGHNKYCIYLVNNTTAPYIFAQKIISGLDARDLFEQISKVHQFVTGRYCESPPARRPGIANLCNLLIRAYKPSNNGCIFCKCVCSCMCRVRRVVSLQVDIDGPQKNALVQRLWRRSEPRACRVPIGRRECDRYPSRSSVPILITVSSRTWARVPYAPDLAIRCYCYIVVPSPENGPTVYFAHDSGLTTSAQATCTYSTDNHRLPTYWFIFIDMLSAHSKHYPSKHIPCTISFPSIIGIFLYPLLDSRS